MSGTWIPVLLAALMLAAYVDARFYELTWERPASYLAGFLFLMAGIATLIKMMRVPAGEHSTVFTLSFFYEKVPLAILFVALVDRALYELYPGVFLFLGEDVLFALFVACVTTIAVANSVLTLGYAWGYLEEEADPVPFRPVYRRWRNRKAARANARARRIK